TTEQQFNKGQSQHYVYILICNDNKHYTGMTRDLKNRIIQHDKGLSISTRNKRPLTLIWATTVKDRITARRLEKKIKHYTAKKFLLHQKYKGNRTHQDIILH
ncbi:unnamed protein product, partial [marine sediment metagenome]